MSGQQGLHDLLDLATDRVEATGLGAGALTTARRRQRIRRTMLASAVVAVVVVGIAVTGQLGGDSSSAPAPAPSPPGPTETVERPHFDPRAVDELPAAPGGLVAALPAELEVPTTSPALTDDPIEAAILTVGKGDAVKVLGVDGVWRHVYPPPPLGGSVELTPNGTRLVVATQTGADVWDLATGARTFVAYPAEDRPAAEVSWHWLDDETLFLDDLGGGWEVDVAGGDAHRTPDPGELNEVVDGDDVARVGWSAADRSLAVSVIDRATGDVRHRLLVRDDNQATYANGGLSVQALLDDGTVLLRVLVPGRPASIRFVAWEPGSGRLSLVMQTQETLPSWSVATDLLR
jgi:hypothetical protein